MLVHEFWDVGEEFSSRPPNLGKTSTARVMMALIKLKGKMYDSYFFGTNDMPDHLRDGVYRISLPVGSKEEFERLSGYLLTRPLKIGIT